MQELLDLIVQKCGWDCGIKSYDGWALHLVSGTSIEYAQPLAVFSGVSYISCPSEFSHPVFRLASNVERASVAKLVPLDEGDMVIAIDAETMANMDRHVFFIAAREVALA